MMGYELRGEWLVLAFSDNQGSGAADIDPDTQLMLRFTEGDHSAFERLFAKYSGPIINFANKFVGDQGMAEDLAQEIFLKVYNGKETYRAEAKFKTWLYRIASNACISELRKPRYKQSFLSIEAPMSRRESDESVPPLDLPETDHTGPLRQLELKEMRKALKDAVEALPENQRLAFIMTKYQNLSYQEVAIILKTTEPAVKSLIHRAKESLIAKLKLSHTFG